MFNAANILLVAAIALSGMAVAFPVGIGLALVLGVLINYVRRRPHRPIAPLLFLGVALVTAAIILDAMAYRKLSGPGSSGGTKGLVLAVLCGILMSLFYFLVARAIGKVEMPRRQGWNWSTCTAKNLQLGVIQAGKMTAYTANVVFAFGILLSSFVFNIAIMKKPFVGEPVPLGDYFKGAAKDHLWGIVGGMIWAVGMTLNIAASGQASPAVAYGLGQGATMVAALWGVFVWREFRNAPRGTTPLLALMFVLFITGLGLVIVSRLGHETHADLHGRRHTMKMSYCLSILTAAVFLSLLSAFAAAEEVKLKVREEVIDGPAPGSRPGGLAGRNDPLARRRTETHQVRRRRIRPAGTPVDPTQLRPAADDGRRAVLLRSRGGQVHGGPLPRRPGEALRRDRLRADLAGLSEHRHRQSQSARPAARHARRTGRA